MDHSNPNHAHEHAIDAPPHEGASSIPPAWDADVPVSLVEPPIRTSHHELMILPRMEMMLQSIERAVERAEDRVSVETYIYRDDTLGRRFGDTLARAVARGVPTRLLYDALGSEETDPKFFEELRARGVDARPYRPTASLASPNAFPRDHGRIIVIDRHAYTGGAAWGDEWLPRAEGGLGWHDVSMRILGPCVEDFAMLFDQRWQEADFSIARPLDFSTADKYPDLQLIGDTPDGTVRVYEQHRAAIQRATKRVWFENAYFFPPPSMQQDLYDAAARGVDVRIIIPSNSDLPLIKRAARAEFQQWIEAGLRVFEYTPAMVHSKYAVIDDDFCTVGTFNANATSTALANEVNLFVYDRAFVARVGRIFASDLTRCEEVTLASLRDRPILEQVYDRLANDAMNMIDLVIGPPAP